MIPTPDFYENIRCPLPWISITIETNGNFRVCCFSNEGIYNEDGIPLNIMTHSIKDAIQSKTHQELRKAMISNIKHQSCQVCWRREDAAQKLNAYPTSTRANRLRNPIFREAYKPDIDDNGNLLSNNIISLDLRLSNLCNMKCIMCSPFFSNLWNQDWEYATGSNKFSFAGSTYTVDKKTSTIPHWETSDKWWKEFDSIKHNLRHLYILGGEPFINKTNEKIISILVNDNLAKNIHIEYDTNLSVVPSGLIENLKKFKKVDICASIDDIEERYELIRFPGKFERVVNNVEKLKEQGLSVHAISVCMGIHNMFGAFRVYDYFSKRGCEKYHIRFLRGPERFNPYNFSDEVKKDILKKYHKMKLPTKFKVYLIGYIHNSMGNHNQEHLNSFVKMMDNLDRIRGTNWKKTFPEISCYFK